MNICIPVLQDRGLQSPVCAHFGSAPAFLIVDSDSGASRAIPNRNQHHGHGMCAPLAALQGEPIDSVVVSGIGMGALNKLNAANIRVYVAHCETAEQVMDAFKAGSLDIMQPGMACAHHGQGHTQG